MYQVVDQTGQAFGPASLDLLRQWAVESRLTPDMIVVDLETARQGPAQEMLAGLVEFNEPVHTAQPQAAPQPKASHSAAGPEGYTYQGSNKAGELPTLQNRAAAFFIDVVLGTSFYLSLRFGLPYLLMPRIESSSPFFIRYLDYFAIPATALYFLLRDAIYSNQSIGKRLSKIKVATTNGRSMSPMHSVLRNITAAPMVLLPLPFLGYLGLIALIVAAIGESMMVLAQGKRFGDTLAMTKVVNE